MFPDADSYLDKSTVEVRGDTAVYKGFYRNGGIRSEITLVDGSANGPSRLFFMNGAVEEKSWYRNGGKEGERIIYFPNGIRNHQEFFVRDTSQADRRMRFDSTGRKISEWTSLGEPGTGIYRVYWKGAVIESTYYRRGIQEGLAFENDLEGDTVSVSLFKDGKIDTTNFKRKAGSDKYGQRTTESLLKVIRRRTPTLRHIYNSHLRPNRFRGKVTLKFAIRPDGGISYLLVLGNSTGNHRFARDVANSIQRWRFEAIETKSNDIVTVPFTFSE